ncbi:MAG: hypothetical protein N2450_05095 [bacterium]|nr:hypothetical protein [bacterium]
MNDPQTTWLDRISILAKYRTFLLRWLFLWIVIGIISFFVWPRKYRAETSFLPPVEENIGLFGSLSMAMRLGNSSDIQGSGFIPILRSKRLKDSLDKTYNFRKRYKEKKLDRAYKAFDRKLEIDMELEEGIGANYIYAFYIRVTDKDPKEAANIANDLVFYADRIAAELTTQRQRQIREFLEKRLAEARDSLSAIEDSLKNFSIRTGVVVPTDQISATVKLLGELETQIASSEVELTVAKTTYGERHPSVQTIEAKLDELKKQRSAMLGNVDYEIGKSLLKLKQSPEYLLEHTRLYRETTSRTITVQFLEKQLEQARINEQRDAPVLRILDRAVPPETRIWPIFTLMVLLGLLFGALSAFIWIGWKEWLVSIQQTQFSEHFQQISKDFSLSALWKAFRGKS